MTTTTRIACGTDLTFDLCQPESGECWVYFTLMTNIAHMKGVHMMWLQLQLQVMWPQLQLQVFYMIVHVMWPQLHVIWLAATTAAADVLQDGMIVAEMQKGCCGQLKPDNTNNDNKN